MGNHTAQGAKDTSEIWYLISVNQSCKLPPRPGRVRYFRNFKVFRPVQVSGQDDRNLTTVYRIAVSDFYYFIHFHSFPVFFYINFIFLFC